MWFINQLMGGPSFIVFGTPVKSGSRHAKSDSMDLNAIS